MSSPSSRSASHNRGINASHLLNFRSQPPPKSNPKPKNFPKKQSQKSFLAQKAEQRARRALSSAFYLHSSCNHAFVLKSDDYDAALSQQQRYVNNTQLSKERLALYHGPDQTMKWHHVDMVKSLVDTHTHTNNTNNDQTNVCPICLSDHVAPRVTKCGHTFCFPCILRHLHNSNNNGNSSDCKCPCCSHPLHASELKPVVFHSVCPPKIGNSMEFSKLYRIKRCFAPFLPPNADNDNNDNEDSHNSSMIRTRSESFHAPRVNDKDALYCRFNYLDTQHQQHHNNNTLMTHLETDVNSLQIYRKENTTDLVGTQFAIMAMEAVRLQMRECVVAAATTPAAAVGNENVVSNKKQSSSSLSIAEDATSGGILFGGEECTQFYQASDGQLCFLSGFNMNCLLTEYTKDHDTSTATTNKTDNKTNPEQQSSSQQPQPNDGTTEHTTTQSHQTAAPSQNNNLLPNKIKGQIIDTEVIHLTPDMRKRFPFLSHLPLYCDVKFVELQLPKQHFSDTTKLFYKSELEKRKKKRRNRLRAEQKLSNRIKKEEEDQVTMRRIGNPKVDFEDEFFRPVMTGPSHDAVVESPLSEGFGPGLGGNGNPTSVTSSAVAATGRSVYNRTVPKPPSAIHQVPKRNLWPDLKTGASTKPNGNAALGGRRKAAMGSAPSPPVWGSSPKTVPSSSTSSSSSSPNRNISSLSKLGSGDSGKKIKGKHKVHLFSTGGGGGHRGGGY